MGMVALVGGDEFRPGCEDMDRAILEATSTPRPRVLIVPTAAYRQNPSKAAANGVSYFSRLGADASALMVLESSDASDESMLSPVDSADVVYLTGGDPSHLLETLRGSMLLLRLVRALDRGAILAGSSAGAMVMGSWMRRRGWQDALGVVDGVAVVPHHERSDPEKVARELVEEAPPSGVVLGIDAMSCWFGSLDGGTVLGSGGVTVYSGGDWRRHVSGDTLSLVSVEKKGSTP